MEVNNAENAYKKILGRSIKGFQYLMRVTFNTFQKEAPPEDEEKLIKYCCNDWSEEKKMKIIKNYYNRCKTQPCRDKIWIKSFQQNEDKLNIYDEQYYNLLLKEIPKEGSFEFIVIYDQICKQIKKMLIPPEEQLEKHEIYIIQSNFVKEHLFTQKMMIQDFEIIKKLNQEIQNLCSKTWHKKYDDLNDNFYFEQCSCISKTGYLNYKLYDDIRVSSYIDEKDMDLSTMTPKQQNNRTCNIF